MFEIDSDVKREALNFATIMEATGYTEHRLDPLFETAGSQMDLTRSMEERGIAREYSAFFGLEESQLMLKYMDVKRMFQSLRDTDGIVKRGRAGYSPSLDITKEAPRFLYLRGDQTLLMIKRTVAVVGSRQAGEEAKERTRRLAKELAYHGMVVVSGLAKGIDAAAHGAVLSTPFSNIAVLATPLNQYYPRENYEVQKEIEKRGLVVSQFSPASRTERWHFSLRNGTLSGLAFATIVMEAEDKSGTLRQADCALKQNRLVLIPKSAFENKNITWPEKFVKRGAKVFDTMGDIFIELSRELSQRPKSELFHQCTIQDMITDTAEDNTGQSKEKEAAPDAVRYIPISRSYHR